MVNEIQNRQLNIEQHELILKIEDESGAPEGSELKQTNGKTPSSKKQIKENHRPDK